MKFQLEKRAEDMTGEELIAEVKSVASTLGKDTLTITDFNDNSELDARSLTKRLGVWGEILKSAGLKKNYNYRLSEDELFQNIADVWIKLGRQPRIDDMTKPTSQISGKTYQHKFGTWKEALNQFVQFANSEGIPTEKSIESNANIIDNHKTKRKVKDGLRFNVMQRDGFKCVGCGRSPATNLGCILHVDHIIPWSKGGETVIENLRTLCSICNLGKSNKEIT